MTTYIVCRRDGSTALTILGTTEASGPLTAMRALGDTTGELTNHVAIPIRNWTEALVGEEKQEPKAVAREIEPVFPGQLALDQVQTGEATDEPREGIEVPADGSEHELVA